MKSIAELISKISSRVFSGEEKKNKIHLIIKDLFGVDLEKNTIRISGKTIYLKTDPILKNRIFLEKTEVLEQINKNTNSFYSDIV